MKANESFKVGSCRDCSRAMLLFVIIIAVRTSTSRRINGGIARYKILDQR